MLTIIDNSNKISENPWMYKKIGIWGFGIVGQSALNYFDQQYTQQIEILDAKQINLPKTQTPVIAILQTKETIETFLENNDFILASPGIKLHAYQQFAHKFINELDILHAKTNCSIIAITGTVGKTSITHLLENIIKHTHSKTIAAGNIGYPMLSLITNPQDIAIIELSSFQLQPIKSFAPDLAIITNFYPNHLDHHQSIDEYFQAKCNILKYQSDEQQALIPLNLIDQVAKLSPIKKNWALFSPTKPTEQEIEKYQTNAMYYLENKIVYRTQNNQTEQLFDGNALPPLTFDTNWLIIIAACHLYKIDLATITSIAQNLALPDHRLQKVGSWHGSNFYNDSKSTVWQATLQAVQAMPTKDNKPIKLFLGGLSKGADRTPLLQALSGKNIEIYAFGKEADQIKKLCNQFKITCQSHATLDASWQACIQNLSQPHEILFSPGGSSFDLFADYKARGQYFTQLVLDLCKLI
ncbi:MAG: UDP-N-acetylmuramoyl-L-alanine--D-glutamate ligase [Candidatus Dependentiae bacterium]|nr:UDP-N-acetylmuramoyl-L-alanine--D-glutamate ligase [Candidatus Dependentiae bacterium]